MIDNLDAYIFPLENDREHKLGFGSSQSRKAIRTARTEDAVEGRIKEVNDDGELRKNRSLDGAILSHAPSETFSHAEDEKALECIQSFLQRRDAVVGESVPPDPGYWYSPAAKQRREEGLLENSFSDDVRKIIQEKILVQNPLFNGYSPFIQKLFEDAFEKHSYRAGEVVSEKFDASPFCYVLQGSVELLTSKEREQEERKKKGIQTTSSQDINYTFNKTIPVTLLSSSLRHRGKPIKRRQGEDFGREGLLHFLYGERFGYIAVARAPSVVLRLSREVYKKILMVDCLESHEMLTNTLNHVRVLARFSDAERSQIARAVKPMSFNKGDVLLAAGCSPPKLLIIDEGVVEVLRPIGSSSCRLPIQVKLLMPSECVGDAEIFSWDACSEYDYVAYSSEVRVLSLDQDYFYRFHGHPLLEHLFDQINVKEVKTRKEFVQNLQHLGDFRHLVDSSSDDEREDVERSKNHSKCIPSSSFLPTIQWRSTDKEKNDAKTHEKETSETREGRQLPVITVARDSGRTATRIEKEKVGGVPISVRNPNCGAERVRKDPKKEIALYSPPSWLLREEREKSSSTIDWEIEESDEGDETDEDSLFVPSVNIKSPEVTSFLLENFFVRRAYCDCNGEECGVAITAFTSPRSLRAGSELFFAEPLRQPDECESVVKARRLRWRKSHPPLDYPQQYLYVVYKGSIELLDREGFQIAIIHPGGSVGEHRLLKNKTAACDVTARVVSTDPKGCEVIRLARHIYRHSLLRTFVGAYEAFQDLFSCLPYANDIPAAHLLVLHQHMELVTLGPASVILAQHVTPREVYIVLDGTVRIRIDNGETRSSSVAMEETQEIFHAQRGDAIGALELIDNVKAQATYIAEGRVQVFRTPASQFASVLRLLIPYFNSLRETSRYRQLYGSSRRNFP